MYFITMKWKIVIGVMMLGILAAGGVYYYLFYQAAEHSDPLKSDDKIVIRAVDLYDMYLRNEDSANRMYLDSVISVSGNIRNIELNQGRYTITLNSNDSNGAVVCEMDIAVNERIRSLKPGDEISLVGFCNGWLMDVQLDRCKINE